MNLVSLINVHNKIDIVHTCSYIFCCYTGNKFSTMLDSCGSQRRAEVLLIRCLARASVSSNVRILVKYNLLQHLCNRTELELNPSWIGLLDPNIVYIYSPHVSVLLRILPAQCHLKASLRKVLYSTAEQQWISTSIMVWSQEAAAMRSTISWNGFSRKFAWGFFNFILLFSNFIPISLIATQQQTESSSSIDWHLTRVGNTFGASAHFLVPVCWQMYQQKVYCFERKRAYNSISQGDISVQRQNIGWYELLFSSNDLQPAFHMHLIHLIPGNIWEQYE